LVTTGLDPAIRRNNAFSAGWVAPGDAGSALGLAFLRAKIG
jgi:hypothetical protein